MTYEQSLQNIENIKNFVLPYGNQVVVFDFQNVDLFQIIFFSNYTDQISDKLRADALNRNCGFAVIENDKNDLPILSYIDDNLTMTFNLELNEVVQFERSKPVNIEKLKNDFMDLIKLLKNA